jgi:phosphoglycolate phosphatase-like HAD superfamily hydrolase
MKKFNIWFDMDGTIADLYNHRDWLKRIRNNDSTVFEELQQTSFTNRMIADIMEEAKFAEVTDITFGIITWTSMEATYEMQLETSKSKLIWAKKFNNRYNLNINFDTHFITLPYGTPKQSGLARVNSKGYQVLIDDNQEVLDTWETKKKRISILASDEWDYQAEFENLFKLNS